MEFYFLNPNKYHWDQLSVIKMVTDSFNFSVLMQRMNNIMDGMIPKLYLHACPGK